MNGGLAAQPHTTQQERKQRHACTVLRGTHPQCRAAGVHGHVHAQQHLIQQLHHPLAGVVGVVQVGGSRTARRSLQAALFR